MTIRVTKQGTGLAHMLDRLSRLGADAKSQGTQILAKTVKTLVVASAAAGTTPDGKPWASTKTGGRPLAAAGSQVSVTVAGTSAVIRIPSPLGFHQTGTSRGLPTRQILPTSMPGKWRSAIAKALAAWFHSRVR